METWEIANRTRGAVEIGCVRTTALQPGERYTFSGPCPDALKWLEGARKVYLTRQEVPVVKKPAVTQAPAQAAQKAEDAEAMPTRGSKSSRQEPKPQAS